MSLPRWSADDLDREVAAGGLVLADLRTPMCTRCGPQEQVLERLRPDYADRVAIGSIDITEHPDVAQRFGVMSVPTHLVFAKGDHHLTIDGFRRAPELRQVLDKLLAQAGEKD